MAEIEIERRRRRSPWKWVVLLLVLAALAAGAWWFYSRGELAGEPSAPAPEIAAAALRGQVAAPPANRLYSHANTAHPTAPSTRAYRVAMIRAPKPTPSTPG
jgi:hypothetical protein